MHSGSRIIRTALAALFAIAGSALAELPHADPASGRTSPFADGLIPRPVELQCRDEPPFVLSAEVRIDARGGAEVANVGLRLSETLVALTDLPLASAAPAGPSISLHLDPDLDLAGPSWAMAEGYRVDSRADGVAVTARTAHGLFNGAMTVAQLAVQADGRWVIPSVRITDLPRFRWRGLMLDCSRHFFSVAEVCRFIDQMALHKFNTFHWHLTDDQGWRVEVKRFPLLTQVGAWRAESPVMGARQKGDGLPYGGFYTQDDLRAVVAHAASRHITVVPELEMPGHSTAAIAAYPELGNNDIPGWKPPATATRIGVAKTILSPKEETFRFIDAVFEEILPIFPGVFVHIGGDEVPKEEWSKSATAQRIIHDQGLKNEAELQGWFVRRVEKMLAGRGKRLIGWDEIQEGGLSPTAAMMVWRDRKWATFALERGNDIVMAPTSHTYLDYGQGSGPAGAAFEVLGGHLPLAKVYGFDPVPQDAPGRFLPQVLGCQGQLWTECIWSEAKLDYMTWPRACALAEVAWSASAGKDYASFLTRLSIHQSRLDRLRINYRKDDGSPAEADRPMERTPRPPGAMLK
jgi:hexosaminidase